MRVYLSLLLAIFVVFGAQAYLLPDLRKELRVKGEARGAPSSLAWFSRDRRTFRTTHRIVDPVSTPADCFLVYPDEGDLFYKAGSDEAPVCGIYLIAPQDKSIELVFNYLDVPCEDGGVVEWVDGWQLNGQVWPAESWSDDRVVESCGRRRPKRVFVSQQNAALLQYRVPARGQGFSIHVRHLHNAKPCNVMLYGDSGVHTIRNYGTSRNCSYVSVGPAAVQILDLDVGRINKHPNSIEMETGVLHQCFKRGIPDHVDIGGSSGLDSKQMEVIDSICGLNSDKGLELLIGCENTAVRLVSSGRYRNSVTVSFTPLGLEDLENVDFLCDI